MEPIIHQLAPQILPAVISFLIGLKGPNILNLNFKEKIFTVAGFGLLSIPIIKSLSNFVDNPSFVTNMFGLMMIGALVSALPKTKS